MSANPQTQGAGFAALLAAFHKASESKLRNPKLSFENLVFSMGKPNSSNPGWLYLKGGREYEAEYYGKISPQGDFYPVSACPPHIKQQVQAIGADPLGECVKFGHRSGNCCACGRKLDDPESVDAGIGPVCRKKWFGK